MNSSIINRAAVKRYALAVAKTSRAHVFTRVAKTFLEDVEARVESKIRQIGVSTVIAIPCEDKLVTPRAVEKFREVIQTFAKQAVCEKVRQQPSAGRTLI